MFVLLVGVLGLTPAFAGSAIIGSVAGSTNATVGGQALLPNTSLFSGDSIRVNDGVAVVALGTGSRMVFGRDTVASFLRDSKEVTVLLGQGIVSMYHPEGSVAMRVKVGDTSVVPAAGFKTLGEVAMLNGTIVVTTKEGSLWVERDGQRIDVAKGKTIALPANPERAPQATTGAAAGGAAHVSASTALEVVGVGVSGASLVTSAVAVSRAGSANTAATAANSTAGSALAAANSAASAASAAASTATVANSGLIGLCSALSPSFPTIVPSKC
jgi:hypothetical protein